MDPNRPFRWDLVRPDRLGLLLDGIATPDLFFLDGLVVCAAQVLGRCADGELHFVGRSVDSLFDLLSGALADTTWRDRLHRFPLSLNGYDGRGLTSAELGQLRANLTAQGLAPDALVRGRPTVFVDLVHAGSTFENLYAVLKRWADDERAPWDVARRQLRFLGITSRTKTSPNTWRWQQHADFAAELPASAIRNISLDPRLWSYFGDRQAKTADAFRRAHWADPDVASPRHADAIRSALAEAVAVVEAGRTPEVRRRLSKLLSDESAISERWLRDLQRTLWR